MKKNLVATGIFVLSALILFGVGLFLIGDRHKAFNGHVDYYANLMNVEGINPGAQVRVSGFDAGEVTKIEVPGKPSDRFRMLLHVENRLKGLIRTDSVVSVETDGLVGDKFILIHSGSDGAQPAAPGSTLPTKEPIELSAVIEKVTGVVDQANATIGDLNKRVDVALDSLTGTINNTNGVVTDVRHGKGTVGMLLSDEKTSQDVKTAVVNARQATVNLDQVTANANQMVVDLQSRNLPQKVDETINEAKGATQQLQQASNQLNASLTQALAPDRTGVDAAQNLRETLANVNVATGNVDDDTEALKHEFLFRGFFKKRGFYSLADLTPEQYRSQKFFQNPLGRRVWLSSADTFLINTDGKEAISPQGQTALESMVANSRETISGTAIVIEGYSSQAAPGQQLAVSKTRAVLIKESLQRHFALSSRNIGVVALNATPPPTAGKADWDGVCILLLAPKK